MILLICGFLGLCLPSLPCIPCLQQECNWSTLANFTNVCWELGHKPPGEYTQNVYYPDIDGCAPLPPGPPNQSSVVGLSVSLAVFGTAFLFLFFSLNVYFVFNCHLFLVTIVVGLLVFLFRGWLERAFRHLFPEGAARVAGFAPVLPPQVVDPEGGEDDGKHFVLYANF